MKRLLMIPLLAIPTWFYSCTHHTPPTPAEVIREAHEALPTPIPNPCAHYPCILPKEEPKPQPKVTKHAPRQTRHHVPPSGGAAHPVAPVEAPQELPVEPTPPRCLFWIIGEAGCERR